MRIVYDKIFLSAPSERATRKDLSLADDLIGTLLENPAWRGMCASMIGKRKRIIAFLGEGDLSYTVMLNPRMLSREGEYLSFERDISYPEWGAAACVRHSVICVEYCGGDMKKRRVALSGASAQTVEHLVDFMDGASAHFIE